MIPSGVRVSCELESEERYASEDRNLEPDKAVPGVLNERRVTIRGLQDPKVRQRREKYRKDGECHEGARGAPTVGEPKEKE